MRRAREGEVLKTLDGVDRKLTTDDLGGVVGGLPGGVSNQTGFDTNGAKLSVQWYAAKFTISRK